MLKWFEWILSVKKNLNSSLSNFHCKSYLTTSVMFTKGDRKFSLGGRYLDSQSAGHTSPYSSSCLHRILCKCTYFTKERPWRKGQGCHTNSNRLGGMLWQLGTWRMQRSRIPKRLGTGWQGNQFTMSIPSASAAADSWYLCCDGKLWGCARVIEM